ncbi:MAG: class I SAM-dependent methyltransferase [Motiliproteus sp.]
MAQYDDSFFDYVSEGAIRSAQALLPWLDALEINSVLDVGCGRGAWLSVWQQQGVETLIGIDGDYVDRNSLLIEASQFVAADLSAPFEVEQQFDLVQSLEVAEHLPPECAQEFVNSLTRHGNLVLFSAAPKGQGGEHHINEQSYQYWRQLFARRGYIAIDYLRPAIADNDKIEPWYRYNSFLYATPERIATLPNEIQSKVIDAPMPLTDVSPWFYQLRKALIATMPIPLMSLLARLKIRLRNFRHGTGPKT